MGYDPHKWHEAWKSYHQKGAAGMDHPGARSADMSLVNQVIKEARADYSERENLQALIDQALDNRDEQEFYRLAAKLL